MAPEEVKKKNPNLYANNIKPVIHVLDVFFFAHFPWLTKISHANEASSGKQNARNDTICAIQAHTV